MKKLLLLLPLLFLMACGVVTDVMTGDVGGYLHGKDKPMPTGLKEGLSKDEIKTRFGQPDKVSASRYCYQEYFNKRITDYDWSENFDLVFGFNWKTGKLEEWKKDSCHFW